VTDLVSQNGWPASPNAAAIGVTPYLVADVPIGDGVRGGVVATVLGYVALQVHRRVEPLVPGWCWGYKYRVVTGGVELSNHASGTAVDLNAPRHPLGSRGTFTDTQVSELRRILGEVDDVVRWGGDYVGRVDEMHFEINADEAAVTAVAARLERRVQILDYSAGYPGGQAIAGARYVGAARYLPKEGGSIVKTITADELRDLVAHDLEVTFIAEHRDPARAFGGYPAGAHDAQWFWTQATSVVRAAGRSESEIRALYFTCDTDTTAANRPAVAEYYLGVQDVIGQRLTGVYGEYDVIEYLAQRNLGSWFWQTYAWSTGHNLDTQPRHPRAHLFQRRETVTVGGVNCDVNDVLKLDYGQLNPQEIDVLTPDDGNVPWAASDPDTGVVETHEVAHWVAIPAYRTGRIQAELRALAAKVDAGFNALSDDEANIVAAVRAQPTGGQVNAAALAAALAPLLQRIPEDQVDALVTRLVAEVPAAVQRRVGEALVNQSNQATEGK
jgi:hypothetical protein